ncbi:hypothetical protein F5Y03DRAFT_159915 [Xylaria venustula]|nr:hypothetical protein F5Y03DRAFT_159915 [Xylaria venustula]
MGHHATDSKHHTSSKPSHPNNHTSKPTRPDRTTHTSTNATPTYTEQPPVSFLFVVNELLLNPNTPPNVDQWGTVMPPFDPQSYASEAPGRVFRYRDGEITEARGYYWERECMDLESPHKCPGSIYLTGGVVPPWEMTRYSQYTVFHCWRPLPCVYMEDDPLCTLIAPRGGVPRRGWCGESRPLYRLSFETPDMTGISHITAGGTSQITAGRNPSWIPSLVPEMFRNEDPCAPVSRGLGGLLPVIVAQMALTQPRGQTDRPFIERWWHRRHWRRPNAGTTVTHPFDIRAVIVHVALDEIENPEGSTKETLENFEAGSVVREN